LQNATPQPEADSTGRTLAGAGAPCGKDLDAVCGILGQLDPFARVDASRHEFVQRGVALLRHRGPDGDRIVDLRNLTVGHCRLSIIDLSDDASQPMRSSSGQSLLVTNGELYNYLELRRELAPPARGWRTSGDTEVMLEAFEQRGVDAIHDFNGMFAFALWTGSELVLGRDRLGEKPLYWTRTASGSFRFASEIGALLTPDTARRTSPGRIAEFLQYGYNLAPRTSFLGIHALPPAHLLRVKAREHDVQVTLERYWDVPPHDVREGSTFESWTEEFGETLASSVEMRLRADVPLSVFLSGGVDSSIVTALASRFGRERFRAVTIDLADPAMSEGTYAREVAAHLGVNADVIHVDPPSLDDIGAFIVRYGELHGDMSAFASLAAARAARRVARVALTGDGSDELLGGYSRYRMAIEGAARARSWPRPFSSFVKHASNRFPPWLRGDGRLALFRRDVAQAYLGIVRQFPSTCTPPLFASPPGAWPDPLGEALERHAGRPPLHQLTMADFDTYIPGDTLPNLDRASMSVGLELRCPFLDHRLFELVSRAEPDWLANDTQVKRPLRHLFASELPERVFSRPKLGFTVPALEWFRGPGAPKLVARLRDPSARIYDILDRRAVLRVLQGFDLRLHRALARVWYLVVLNAWLEHFDVAIEESEPPAPRLGAVGVRQLVT
jgi:asparagine synthase (glutamine-hydrolysing)